MDAREDQLAVSLEVADDRIDLGQSKAHRFPTQSLKHRGESAGDGFADLSVPGGVEVVAIDP